MCAVTVFDSVISDIAVAVRMFSASTALVSDYAASVLELICVVSVWVWFGCNPV